MAVSVKFGTTSDPTNMINKTATLRDTAVSCELKDSTSVISPVFIVKGDNINKTDNYAYCSDFGRYYYITDISLSPEGWYVSCTVDPLKTYATQILSKEYNIDRSEHRDINTSSGMLCDPQLNRLSEMDVQVINADKGIDVASTANTQRRYVLIMV